MGEVLTAADLHRLRLNLSDARLGTPASLRGGPRDGLSVRVPFVPSRGRPEAVVRVRIMTDAPYVAVYELRGCVWGIWLYDYAGLVTDG